MATKKASTGGVSADTQKLLQSMMKDSGLTPFQQKQLQAQMTKGGPLPTHVDPTTSKPKAAASVAPKSPAKSPKRVDPAGPMGIRTHALLDKPERDGFRPEASAFNSEVEREKLHDVMAFGKETAEKKQVMKAQFKSGELKPSPKPARSLRPPNRNPLSET